MKQTCRTVFTNYAPVMNSPVHYISCKSLRKFVYRWNVNNYTNINLPFAIYPALDNELLRCSHEQIVRQSEGCEEGKAAKEERGGRQLRVIRRCCEKMAVADVFSTLIVAIFLPLLSLSAQLSLARHDRRPARDFFLLRSCSIQPDPRKNRKDAQETAVAASLHSLISRAEEEPLHRKPARYGERRNLR